MQTIKKSELKNKYGINLNKGLYKVVKEGNKYKIYTVKDDTSGCVIVGTKSENGKVLESRKNYNALMKRLETANNIKIDIC